jgi:hypothetical protein
MLGSLAEFGCGLDLARQMPRFAIPESDCTSLAFRPLCSARELKHINWTVDLSPRSRLHKSSRHRSCVFNLLGDLNRSQKRDLNRLDSRNIASFGISREMISSEANIPQESFQYIANASHLCLPCEAPQSLPELSSIPLSSDRTKPPKTLPLLLRHLARWDCKAGALQIREKPPSEMIIYS